MCYYKMPHTMDRILAKNKTNNYLSTSMKFVVILVLIAILLFAAGQSHAAKRKRFSPKARSISTGDNTCGGSICPQGDLCCSNNYIGFYRNQCYSPSTHHCIPDDFRPAQNCLCGKNDGCCNQVCFDSRHYTCDRHTGELKQIDSPSYSAEPSSYSSPQQSHSEPSNPEVTYSPAPQQTYSQQPSYSSQPQPEPTKQGSCGQFQCGSSDLCCSNNVIGFYSDQCYSPNTHHCIPDEYRPEKNCLCGKYDGCCNRVCFDASRYQCIAGSIVWKGN